MIELSGINKIYGEGRAALHVLKDVDLAIQENEFVAILGASGSGKSTLMNIIGCLDQPSSGSYRLGGDDVSQMIDDKLSEVRNREIGFIFQSFHLIPQLTVIENVEVPQFYMGVAKGRRHERSREVLDLVGLSDRTRHKPAQLSGGERQRVAIARSLVNDPTLLLADEPTGNLDSKTGEEILQLFGELHSQARTILMITHDRKIASRAQRRIMVKDGRVIDDTGEDVR